MNMKKFFSTLTMMSFLAVTIPLMTTESYAASSAAVTKTKPSVCRNARTGKYYYCKKPNFYRRHRKAINIAAGAGVGALVGGLLGGKKWALIGGLGGAGGGALFTHKQKPKNYIRPYRNY